MFDKFTDRARMVMSEANNEARRLESSHLGTEHLLLGMIKEGGGVAAQVLKGQDVNSGAVVREALAITVSSATSPENPDLIVFTPRCKGALDKAESEARRLRHDYIGTEHLILGLLLEEESVALQVLIALGKDPGRLYSETLRLVGGEAPDADARASDSGPGRLGLSIRVSADTGGEISEIKKEMASLANRLGVTVHAELNDELCMACPGEEVARVYMKKERPKTKPLKPVPLLSLDQIAVMRHAMQAGLRSVPVFARSFGLTLSEIEKIMGEISVPESDPEPKSPCWETVYSPEFGAGELLERWPIPRGWIYRSTQWTDHDGDDPGPLERSESMTTVQS